MTACTHDETTKMEIVLDSIRKYDGPCPCPYFQTDDGRQCGKQSAYDRPDGQKPYCFTTDVTKEAVAQWETIKKANRIQNDESTQPAAAGDPAPD